MKTGSDKRLIMTKNLIMMFVILAVLLMAIFAWYTSSYSVTAEKTAISAKSTDDVELALPDMVQVGEERVESFPLDDEKWKNNISFNNSGFLKNFVKDVTSNGEQFAIPNFQAATGLKEGRKVIADDAWVDGLSSKQALTNEVANDDDQYNYVSFEFYMRSKLSDISVLGDSFLAAGSELGINEDGEITKDANDNVTSQKPLVGNNVYRCSSYGAGSGTDNAFSADAIVGAMRVSLECAPVDGVTTNSLTQVNTETAFGTQSDFYDAAQLKFVWLPRPDVFLNTDNDSKNWRLLTGIKPSGNSERSGGLSAAAVDEIAKQRSYCHSFFYGNTIEETTVKKGLTYNKYWDKANYSDSESAPTWQDGAETRNAVNPDIFKVSVTKNDGQLGNQGHYPTLGQSAKIIDSGVESSKNIEFNVENDENKSGYYVYKCKLNIWIEGEDAEARRSMNNGVFGLELAFGT